MPLVLAAHVRPACTSHLPDYWASPTHDRPPRSAVDPPAEVSKRHRVSKASRCTWSLTIAGSRGLDNSEREGTHGPRAEGRATPRASAAGLP